jgi:hypothetical protein
MCLFFLFRYARRFEWFRNVLAHSVNMSINSFCNKCFTFLSKGVESGMNNHSFFMNYSNHIRFDPTADTSDTSSVHLDDTVADRISRHPEYDDTRQPEPLPRSRLQAQFESIQPQRGLGVGHGSMLVLNDRLNEDHATGEYDHWGEFPVNRIPLEVFQYFYPEEVMEQ